MANTRRLTLELSEETYQMLEGLAEKSRTSKVNIIREGLGLRKFAQEVKEEGKHLAVVSDNTIETKILLT